MRLNLFLPRALLLGLLSLGLLFRTVNLDQKVFWVDEVATAIRAVGYTKAEVTAQLADAAPHLPAELLAYQRLTPHRSPLDTLHALVRSPEHAPLYFLLTRFWMQSFGSSVSAIRSLSVLCSLLVLPGVYWFGRELALCCAGRLETQQMRTASLLGKSTGQLGTAAAGFVAISPFFVAYAQEARPYSLWLLALVLSSGALLRATRLNSAASWVLYTVTLVLSLYTSLLSLLPIVGQGIYVMLVARFSKTISRRYLVAAATAMLLFSPWLGVIWQHQAALAANTTWMRTSVNPLSILAIWLYSFAVLFFDVPVVASGWLAVGQAVTAALVLTSIGYALYQLVKLPRRISLLIATLSLPVPLLLILLDLLFQGQASATPRYLVPSQLGIMIAVACLTIPVNYLPSQNREFQQTQHSFPKRTASRQRPGFRFCFTRDPQQLANRCRQGISVFLLSLSLISCLVNLHRSPDYQKDRNRYNPEIAAVLNQATNPVLFAASDQTLDLLSLSHSLKQTVKIYILPPDRLLSALSAVNSCESAFLFQPSPMLRAATSLNLTQVYQPPLLTSEDVYLSLWSVQPQSSCAL